MAHHKKNPLPVLCKKEEGKLEKILHLQHLALKTYTRTTATALDSQMGTIIMNV